MDLKRSELHLLISLDVLLTELNVTRAAEKLHIGQSTLSGHLARLRTLFEDPLLVPSENGRGMVPTELALALRPALAQALAELRTAVATVMVFDPATSRRSFVVASNDSVFTMIGLDVMAQVMRQNNPGLKIAFVPTSPVDMVERMAAGEIDLYVGDIGKVPSSLRARFLLTDDFVLAQRREHPRGPRPPSLDDYCALSHVVVSSRGGFSTPVDDVLAALGRERMVVAAVPSYNQVALVLSQTNGVATLPRRLLQRYQDMVDLAPLPFAVPSFRLAMAWHPRAQRDPGALWLRSCFLHLELDP